ncbi:MAG: glutamine synthetase [Lachnospiraceae bacterium]|uniref:Glutamine synthetase n=1 Tax=Candidatus Weimeria bifida TaxID=2599074 RepID=A0A6N7IZ33_9FIRM|nr:glutamine synthetase [Candidatus Weimeria bifida]RRF97054.1 MAG: glutamine synthetase [Lachnospiraceae bacterium]
MAGYTVEEALQYVEENDVRFIRLAFSDMLGNHKNIAIQPDILGKAFDSGIAFDAFRILGYDDPKYRDLYLKPDPNTLSVLPWRPQAGRVIRFYCNVVTQDGTPYPYDSRKFLSDTIKECKKAGFSVRLGLRSEFFLFKNDEDGFPTQEPMDSASYFDVAPLDRGENIRREICLTLSDMDVPPISSHHEVGPGQNEIEFRSAGALHSADHFMTYKNVVTTIAARNGLTASFEPKPLEGLPGNGFHIKISLFREAQNLFDTDPEMVFSFMAGIFNRIREITVFLNPKKESYLRFGEDSAPKYLTWSHQNESRMIRIPMVHGKYDFCILRSPDSMMNPYIGFAMMIQAGLEGVKNNEKLPEPLEKPGYLITEEDRWKYSKLPLSLAEAYDVAKESGFLKDEKRAAITERFLNTLKDNEL